MVVPVTSKQQLEQAIEYYGLVVVDFHAEWCGPCKILLPFLVELEESFPEVRFLKVDVDALRSVAEEYEVTSLPTVLFFREGLREGRVVGANLPAIKQAIAALA